MVNGLHVLIYAQDAGRAREFFRDVLGWSSVDAGHGWLIFALPPAEIAAHPAGQGGGESGRCDLYFMCEDIHETVEELRAKDVQILRPVADRGWGLVTAIQIPGGGEVGLYQPKHPIAYNLGTSGKLNGATKKKAPAKQKAVGKKKTSRAKRR
jgi:predicted enzyme related to lactoylglutathione lyase